LASLIEKAFALSKVDMMIAGNLTDIQVSLGLDKREEVDSFDQEIDSMTEILNDSTLQALSQKPQGFFNTSSQKKIKRKK
jgi:hypothetical protein